MAGVIDPDYRGDVKVILHNFGKITQHIKRNQKIAQMILEKAAIPDTTPVENLNNTRRGTQGFGSTDKTTIHTKLTTLPRPIIPIPHNVNHNRSTAAAAKLNADLHIAFDVPYHMNLSTDPYDNHTTREILVKPTDKSETLGMIIDVSTQKSSDIIRL